jgi:hypothetical protein
MIPANGLAARTSVGIGGVAEPLPPEVDAIAFRDLALERGESASSRGSAKRSEYPT